MKQLFSILVCCFIFNSTSVFAVDPGLEWKTIENEHLYVHFAQGNQALAERAMAIAELAHQRLTRELDWVPREKTHIILSDETDQPNGYATPIYFNRTVLYLAPPSSINTLEDFDDWLTTLIVHEYTHIVHLDKSAGSPEYLRKIFGRFFFLFPNLYQPLWVIEGLATHKETDVQRGVGRGQSTLFASMMRQEVANGVQPVSHVNLLVNTWPGGATRYLYGVYFMQFLAEEYGEDQLQYWVTEYSDNLLPFFINTNAKKTLGKNLAPLWQEFDRWLNDKFQPQILTIKAKGIRQGERLSVDAYRTDSVQAVLTEKGEEVYYVTSNGYQRARLMHVDAEGKTGVLLDLNNTANLDVNPEGKVLLTQNEFCNNYTIYSDIYLYDKSSGELERLTECGRYIFASWMPDAKQIVAVHHDAAQFELHLLDAKARLSEVLWQAENGEIVGQIDISPDGETVAASVWRKGSGWNIELFDLHSQQWRPLTSGASIAMNPQYTADGNILYTLEADGVYNLYRYSSSSMQSEQLTNLIGGAFKSSQAKENGPIYYSGYAADGYAIYKLDESILKSAALINEKKAVDDSQLQLIEYANTSYQSRDYSALSNMYPRWWFPGFQFTEQRSELGVTTMGGDALGIHNYSLSASYDTKLDKPAGRINYAYSDQLFLSAAQINEISLDTNSQLNRISKRTIAGAVLAFHDRYIQTQSDYLFGVIFDKTADDELFSGAAALDDFEDHLLGVAWLYNSADLNPLSISLNDGMNLRLVAEDSDALNSDFSGQVYTLDWRQYIRTGKESVFAVRFLQGWGTDRSRVFKLGGEGFSDDALGIIFGENNGGVFNQRSYALRGYKEGLPQLRGRRAQILTGEWRFPIERIEKGIMAPPVAIMQWFGSVFAETGSAYNDSPDTYYSSAGIELNADIALFYNLILRTRLGYAHGFDSELGDDRVYLKIGSSF